MARADRLFRLLEALRRLPAPVTAARLAAETGVSPRTLYRDIDALRAGGALIDGAAGYDYTLTEDPALPPQTLTRLEIEALVLGMAGLRFLGDPGLAAAGESALAKIAGSLPEAKQMQALHAVLGTYRARRLPEPPVDMALLRQACWEERALDLTYCDAAGQISQRRIWPLALYFQDQNQTLLSWCTVRQDFRMFLAPRMQTIALSAESFRPRRVPLLRDYIAQMRARTPG
jgi:predicted DNA-binding transcriptional regulator YafY